MRMLHSLSGLRAATLGGCLGLLPMSFSCAQRPAPTTAPAPAPASAGPVGFAAEGSGTTGGAAGRTVTATTLAELTTYATSNEPLVIRIPGTISGGTEGVELKVKSDKTLRGVGATGFLEGIGLNISSQHNIIVQNLKFTMSTVTRTAINDENRPQVVANDGDCIRLQGSSHHVWIDHCELFNLDPVAQPNQDLYDGLIDAKAECAYVTLSWNYFHDHHKCHLIGSSDKDAGDRKMTFHHNYYYNITERVPVYRYGTAHLFSNYFRHVYGTGVNSRMGACLRVEQNYFEDVKNPIVSKNSPQPGGWDVAGNLFVGCTGSQPTTSTCSFRPAYSYTAALTPAADVKQVVMQGAGVGKLRND